LLNTPLIGELHLARNDTLKIFLLWNVDVHVVCFAMYCTTAPMLHRLLSVTFSLNMHTWHVNMTYWWISDVAYGVVQ